jgi:hypothetical protein
MAWLPRNLPERGALRYLLHRGRERVIPGILNLPHPAGASRPGQPGANPQANTLNLRKNADHRPGVEYRRLVSPERVSSLVVPGMATVDQVVRAPGVSSLIVVTHNSWHVTDIDGRHITRSGLCSSGAHDPRDLLTDPRILQEKFTWSSAWEAALDARASPARRCHARYGWPDSRHARLSPRSSEGDDSAGHG